jgi:hypothetical protein
MDIYINKNMVPLNTFKKDKINDSFTTIYILILFGKILCIEKKLELKICLCWKIIFIEKDVCVEKLLHIKNVAFKIILGTLCKIDVWKLSFFFRKKIMKMII